MIVDGVTNITWTASHKAQWPRIRHHNAPSPSIRQSVMKWSIQFRGNLFRSNCIYDIAACAFHIVVVLLKYNVPPCTYTRTLFTSVYKFVFVSVNHFVFNYFVLYRIGVDPKHTKSHQYSKVILYCIYPLFDFIQFILKKYIYNLCVIQYRT
jgi:hypothetical protein